MSNKTEIKNDPNRRDREAVERIRQILGDLGPHSYVRAAMEGVLEMAEDNIQKGVYRSYKREAEALKQMIQRTQETEEKTEDIETEKRNAFSNRWFEQKDRLEKDWEKMKCICIEFIQTREKIEDELKEMQKTLSYYMIGEINAGCERTIRREKEKEECTTL